MTSKIYRYILVVLLAITAAISAYILAVDDYLWIVNPINNHATGLTLFLVGDIALAILLFLRMKLTVLMTAVWGILQIGLIGGDIMTGMGLRGNTTADAYDYLILGKGNVTGFATDGLIVVYALISAFSIPAFLKLRKETVKPVAVQSNAPEKGIEGDSEPSSEKSVNGTSQTDTNISKP